MTTGQFIKEQRLKKGMTQEDLAGKTDVTSRTIQRIENDEVHARAYTLQQIAAALEINFEQLNTSNNPDFDEGFNKGHIWLPLLHLSGLLPLLVPPLVIWFIKKDDVKNIREHAIDVVNFQLSMLLYMVACGLLSFLVIPAFIAPLLLLFSLVVVLINTIKVFNGQTYRYPLTLKILKP